MNVVILATCRNPELLPATLLVFKTLRIGFPTANITVFGNQLPPYVVADVVAAVRSVRGAFVDSPPIRHDDWVQQMLWNNDHPFVICDTDMVFFRSVEEWDFTHPWAGYLQPEYFDPYSKTIYRSRLHTSLLFIRPDEVRDRMLRFEGSFPKAPTFNSAFQFIRQHLQPVRVGNVVHTLFSDTGATLYHAIGGDGFTDAQKDDYAHLHAGTWSDLLGMQLRELHEACYANLESVRGLWRQQEEFYRLHPSPLILR